MQWIRTKRTDRWQPIVGHNQSQPVRVASIGFLAQQEMANLFLLQWGSVKKSSKILLLLIVKLKATIRSLSPLSQNQLLDAMVTNKLIMATCEMCGQAWGGATLGKMFHCRPLKPAVRAERKRDIVQEKNQQRCECGNLATTFSAGNASMRICQRCRDCESQGHRGTTATKSVGETYNVRLPKWGK